MEWNNLTKIYIELNQRLFKKMRIRMNNKPKLNNCSKRCSIKKKNIENDKNKHHIKVTNMNKKKKLIGLYCCLYNFSPKIKYNYHNYILLEFNSTHQIISFLFLGQFRIG